MPLHVFEKEVCSVFFRRSYFCEKSTNLFLLLVSDRSKMYSVQLLKKGCDVCGFCLLQLSCQYRDPMLLLSESDLYGALPTGPLKTLQGALKIKMRWCYYVGNPRKQEQGKL